MTMFVVAGRVVDASAGRRVRGGEVELRQRGLREPVATAAVDDAGVFHFELSDGQLAERIGRRRPNLHLRVSQGGTELRDAQGRVGWQPSAERTFLEVPVRVPAERASTEELVVESYAALLEHQDEIVERVNRTANGGHLFLVEPFRLLADIGVTVTPAAREEIVRVHPGLTGISGTPYEALKASDAHQALRYRIRRLDQRERRDG